MEERGVVSEVIWCIDGENGEGVVTFPRDTGKQCLTRDNLSLGCVLPTREVLVQDNCNVFRVRVSRVSGGQDVEAAVELGV